MQEKILNDDKLEAVELADDALEEVSGGITVDDLANNTAAVKPKFYTGQLVLPGEGCNDNFQCQSCREDVPVGRIGGEVKIYDVGKYAYQVVCPLCGGWLWAGSGGYSMGAGCKVAYPAESLRAL